MAERTALVRLSNWIGDVVLTLPALQLIASQGWQLQLVGKGWARSLLAGTGWPVQAYPKRLGERVHLLRRLAGEARRQGQGVRSLCFPNSFGGALEFRLAGVPAVGYRKEGRRLLLADSLPLPQAPMHELQRHWQLACRFLGVERPAPAQVELPVCPSAQARADALLTGRGVRPGFVLIVPFATGVFSGHDKKWPHFPVLTAWLLQQGLQVVVCPGPGEVLVREASPGTIMLDGLDLADYLAVLRRAALVVANDTGPGHMAAAVGAPVVSLLGPSDPQVFGPVGPQVLRLHDPAWVSLATVQQAVAERVGLR